MGKLLIGPLLVVLIAVSVATSYGMSENEVKELKEWISNAGYFQMRYDHCGFKSIAAELEMVQRRYFLTYAKNSYGRELVIRLYNAGQREALDSILENIRYNIDSCKKLTYDKAAKDLADYKRLLGLERKGKINTAVEKAQQKLAEAGYNPGSVDGKMGEKTRKALKLFQQDKQIPITGKLDSATRKALNM